MQKQKNKKGLQMLYGILVIIAISLYFLFRNNSKDDYTGSEEEYNDLVEELSQIDSELESLISEGILDISSKDNEELVSRYEVLVGRYKELEELLNTHIYSTGHQEGWHIEVGLCHLFFFCKKYSTNSTKKGN